MPHDLLGTGDSKPSRGVPSLKDLSSHPRVCVCGGGVVVNQYIAQINTGLQDGKSLTELKWGCTGWMGGQGKCLRGDDIYIET